MRKDATTDDYRNATSGEGKFGSLGYDWSDKPHRLLYDLCDEVDELRREIEFAEVVEIKHKIEIQVLKDLLMEAHIYLEEGKYYDIDKARRAVDPNFMFDEDGNESEESGLKKRVEELYDL